MDKSRQDWKLYVWPNDDDSMDRYHRVLVTYSRELEQTIFITIRPEDVIYEPLQGYEAPEDSRVTLPDEPIALPEPEVDDPDPWPILPVKTDKQHRDDGIEVNMLLYHMNQDTAIDMALGTMAKLFRYSEEEPIREIYVDKKRKE